MYTHSILPPLMLALLLSFPSQARAAWPSNAVLAATDPASLSIALVLETEVSSDALAAGVEAAFEAELERVRAAAQLERASEAGDLLVRVRVWEPEPDTAVIDATVEFEGATLDSLTGLVCMGCSVEDIASKTLALVPGAVEQARATRAAEPPAPTLACPPEPEPEARRGAVMGPAGYVGIVASGLGLASSIAGVVFLHRGRVVESEPGAAVEVFTDYRPLGLGLVGAGLGAMVVGNVLLGVDLGLLRDRRDRRARSHAQVRGVQVTADHGLALAVHGQF